MRGRGLRLIIIAVAVVGALILFRVLRGILVDYWWFSAVGYRSVYVRIVIARVILWAVGFVLAFGAAALGLLGASRLMGPLWIPRLRVEQLSLPPWLAPKLIFGMFWALAVLAGLVGGSAWSGLWHRVLLFLNRAEFGAVDPIFGNDVGFYVFTYPVLSDLRGTLVALVWVCLTFGAAFCAVHRSVGAGGETFLLLRPLSYASKLAGLLFLLSAAGHLLARYELLYSREGVAFGAGYADVQARLPARWIMAFICLGVAGVLFIARYPRRTRLVIGALGVWLGGLIFCLGLYPQTVQRFKVEPNELDLETPYIERAIAGTLAAYKLDAAKTVPYDVTEDLGFDGVQAHSNTVENIRLWDWEPLSETYGQIQGIRPYYQFSGVDVDRYMLPRGYTQTMLAVRELNSAKLPEEAQTWVNRHFVYTHGYGLCMNAVNEHDEEGLPVLLLKDLPPVGPPGIEVTRPGVYYGRLTAGYIFVRTDAEEFDYPKGDVNVRTRYEGRGGVPIGGLFRRLVYAIEFGDVNILLPNAINSESRVMYRRQIGERVRRVAPYLALDHNPYAVIHEGGIHWIQDAYTVSSRYPYSEPTSRRFNYIRNSVKVVIDAYDGEMTFYVAEPEDPLIQVYQRIFPAVYRPIAQMPEGLRRHVRYPEDLFNIQVRKYLSYHMRDPGVFYNQEDRWEVPLELYHGQERPVRSYYIIMALPGREEAEFLLMLPLTPRGKDNMIAWMAGRCDGASYGELLVYQFPKGKLVFGPYQVEARIDQDPLISQQITLWGQRGSSVLRGNLLVIPIAGDILYAEPLYIRAEGAALPQLKRVITAYGKRVAMGETLEESLAQLFAVEPRPAAPEAPEAPQPVVPAPAARRPRALLDEAMAHYEAAQEALQDGDWAEYGRRLEQMRKALDALAEALPPPAE